MNRSRRFGFTLLELSIVLVILALMLAGTLASLTQDSRLSQREELVMKIGAIEQAVIAYTKRSDTYRLPCPADPAVAITDPNFGIAEAALGCPSPLDLYRRSDFVAGVPAANGATTGAVPVKTIGLPDDYAFDPWGNQFSYTVDQEAALANALASDPVNNPAAGDLIVMDMAGNPLTDRAVMVLLSYGPNKFGGFSSAGVRRDLYSNNQHEWENCNCGPDGTYAPPIYDYDGTFIIGVDAQDFIDEENSFDDIVRYYDRSFFRLSSELLL